MGDSPPSGVPPNACLSHATVVMTAPISTTNITGLRICTRGSSLRSESSAASNLGPTNQTLISDVRKRVLVYDASNRHPGAAPGDAVTASGSGLDPQISPANARVQAPRIARVRGLPLAVVLSLVDKYTDGRSLGFLGEPGVNVLELNLALDRQA